MFRRFQYESQYYTTLSRLPLDLRRKLDLIGLKISLKDWLAFSLEERAVLCHLPNESVDEQQAFQAFLDFLSRKYLGRSIQTTEPMSASLWNGETVPEPVLLKSTDSNAAVTRQEWTQWHDHDRYALYKTAISTNQPEAFAQILNELRGRKNQQLKADN